MKKQSVVKFRVGSGDSFADLALYTEQGGAVARCTWASCFDNGGGNWNPMRLEPGKLPKHGWFPLPVEICDVQDARTDAQLLALEKVYPQTIRLWKKADKLKEEIRAAELSLKSYRPNDSKRTVLEAEIKTLKNSESDCRAQMVNAFLLDVIRAKGVILEATQDAETILKYAAALRAFQRRGKPLYPRLSDVAIIKHAGDNLTDKRLAAAVNRAERERLKKVKHSPLHVALGLAEKKPPLKKETVKKRRQNLLP